jgi:hypothetical protein
MGAGGASTGGSDTSDEKKQDSYAKQFKKNYKVNKYGKVEEKNFVEKYIDNSPILNNPITRKTEQVNRDFFENKVKKAGKSKYDNYEDYIRARGRGEVDAYGREITNTGGGNNQPAQETIIKKNIGGSEVQTTQAKIDEQRAKDDEYDIRKVKKEGRKRYTLTSSKGVTQVSDDYSLGKKSLLGSV